LSLATEIQRGRVIFFIILMGSDWRSFAQTDVPAELKDRPPVAAPTSKIDVNRSMSSLRCRSKSTISVPV